jgi:hypothetical protein
VRIAVDTPQAPAIVTESDNRVSVPDTGIIDIALRDNRDVLPPPASVASASMPDPVQNDIEVDRALVRTRRNRERRRCFASTA